MLASAGAGRGLIQDGDMVIVYERHDRMKAVCVRKGAQLQNRYGMFNHSDWIGKPFGCKVLGTNGQSFVHLLAPNPELWTLSLPHRTQILYLADISFVISYLELRPGSLVLESGTGSGSLTTSLARAVAPSGHVHTFDFHEQRASAARQDFDRHGLSKLVTAYKRDVQGEGFPEEFSSKADAVFLDLPQPWLAVPSVASSLHWGGAVCSFSPCMEQVQRTVSSLVDFSFRDIRTFEVLLRSYEVQKVTLAAHFGNAASPPRKRACPGTDEREMAGSSEWQCKQCVVARPSAETKGHTGYLTFAWISS